MSINLAINFIHERASRADEQARTSRIICGFRILSIETWKKSLLRKLSQRKVKAVPLQRMRRKPKESWENYVISAESFICNEVNRFTAFWVVNLCSCAVHSPVVCIKKRRETTLKTLKSTIFHFNTNNLRFCRNKTFPTQLKSPWKLPKEKLSVK